MEGRGIGCGGVCWEQRTNDMKSGNWSLVSEHWGMRGKLLVVSGLAGAPERL